jgi:2-iminobutanoate/2-iminopropanoate deaminase
MPTSQAKVPTDAASRYAKQLLSHLGHRAQVEALEGEPDGGRLVFERGTARSGPRATTCCWWPRPPTRSRCTTSRACSPGTWSASAPAASSSSRGSPSESRQPARCRDMVRVIHTDRAPTHVGPVPQAVEAGGWVYVSALFGTDPATYAIPADARAEAEQLFDNLAAILDGAGVGSGDVVRVGIVMRHLQRDRPTFNAVWAGRFGDHRPARSAIESADFGRVGEDARFMAEATAYAPR